MFRRSRTASVWSGFVVALLLHSGESTALAIEPATVCLSIEDRCHVVGSRIRVWATLSDSEVPIVAGQLVLSFDAAALELLDVHPGGECDSESPFSVAVFEQVDHENGTALLGVGVNPGDEGAVGPRTLACFDFRVRFAPTRKFCLLGQDGPTFLVDNGGALVPASGDACPTGSSPPDVNCAGPVVYAECQCGHAPTDCTPWDTDCSVGQCHEDPGRCVPVPTNEGAACDDGSDCTTMDRCQAGQCVGSGCPNPSVCVSGATDCSVGNVELRLSMGASGPAIVGGQFALHFDPALLDLIAIEPGAACDPASPFVLELFEAVDSSQGEIAYAVGLNPIYYSSGLGAAAGGSVGTHGPATLACMRFAVRQPGVGDVCLTPGVNPLHTLLVDDTGAPIDIHNGLDCPSAGGSGTLSCGIVDVREICECSTDADCSSLTTQCELGVCDRFQGHCAVLPANETDPCDDGDACTTVDFCKLGRCVGTQCQQPSLCVLTEDACLAPGLPLSVVVRLGASTTPIVGGQFSLQYDAESLDLISIEPGAACDSGSPFSMPIYQSVNENTGEVFYAVGVGFTEPGTLDPAVMACLQFTVLLPPIDDICLINRLNPLSTVLVTDQGQAARISNAENCPTSLPFPTLSCDDVCVPIPALQLWGLIILVLLLLTVEKTLFRRPSRP